MSDIVHVHIFVRHVLKINQLANDLWKWTPTPESCLLYYSFVNARARWRSELTPSPGTQGREGEREAGNSKAGANEPKGGSAPNIFLKINIASSFVHNKYLNSEVYFYLEPQVQSYVHFCERRVFAKKCIIENIALKEVVIILNLGLWFFYVYYKIPNFMST